MDPTVLVALLGLLGTVMAGLLGWFAKVTVAGLKPTEPWNGTERRMKDIAAAAVTTHQWECPLREQLAEKVDKLREELLAKMDSIRLELRGDIDRLHNEIKGR